MFRFDEEYSYRMPPHFGGVKGSGLENLRYDDVTCVSLSYLTDIDAVSKYVPDAFEIMDPVLNLSYQKCCGVRWMGGGEYSLIAVMTPARHLPTGTEGAYILVIWENKTAPILGGREECGMPKVFADIPDYHRLDELITFHASHEGRVFLEVELRLERELTADELEERTRNGGVNQLGWRYIPNIGRPGAALSHATLYPAETKYLSGSVGAGKVAWTRAEALFNPVQAPVVNALEGLPVLEYREGMFAKAVTNLRADLARDLG